MPIALREIGVSEYAGAAANPRIVEYLSSTTIGDPYRQSDETAWCLAFVNWCFEKSGYAGTDSASARSWLTWGQAIDTPRRGCVCVLSRGTDKKKGHVGFYLKEEAGEIALLGGNQSNAVNVAKRSKATLLGYRIPL